MRDNNSFHVLARINYDDHLPRSLAAPEQKHFFVHTSDEGRAVTLVSLALEGFKKDNPVSSFQFTVKSAAAIPLITSTSPQEEVYSI